MISPTLRIVFALPTDDPPNFKTVVFGVEGFVEAPLVESVLLKK
jgi:hypothetical protein